MYVGKETDPSTRPWHTATQTAINRLLIGAAKSGKTVVRLKGGDPVLFGRGGEEAMALVKAGVPFEIVPGVTSATAVPAYAGIPVTERTRSSSVAIVTGHEDPTKPERVIDWKRLATATDTLVILMGVGALKDIAERLMRYGRSRRTPSAIVEWGTLPRQRTVTAPLQQLAQRARRAGIRPPAVIIVGDVVALRSRLNWFERKPLFGRRILVTRASEKAEALTRQLETLGAEVEELPAIALAPVKSNGVLHDAVHELPHTDWVFFTSPEGVGWFSKMLKPLRRDLRWLKNCHIGAIGVKTAASLEAHGLHVDFVPKRFSQEGMLGELPKRVLSGKRALIFSALGSRDVLEEGLRRRGMRVTKVPIYQTVLPKTSASRVVELFGRSFDLVTVTSASCVEHLHRALQEAGRASLFRRLRFASIGPVTSAAVRTHGGRVAVQASVSTIEGLLDAMRKKARAR